MWGEINLGKGSKRRVRQVRWKRSEMVSMVLLLIVVVIESILLAVWLMTHAID